MNEWLQELTDKIELKNGIPYWQRKYEGEFKKEEAKVKDIPLFSKEEIARFTNTRKTGLTAVSDNTQLKGMSPYELVNKSTQSIEAQLNRQAYAEKQRVEMEQAYLRNRSYISQGNPTNFDRNYIENQKRWDEEGLRQEQLNAEWSKQQAAKEAVTPYMLGAGALGLTVLAPVPMVGGLLGGMFVDEASKSLAGSDNFTDLMGDVTGVDSDLWSLANPGYFVGGAFNARALLKPERQLTALERMRRSIDKHRIGQYADLTMPAFNYNTLPNSNNPYFRGITNAELEADVANGVMESKTKTVDGFVPIFGDSDFFQKGVAQPFRDRSTWVTADDISSMIQHSLGRGDEYVPLNVASDHFEFFRPSSTGWERVRTHNPELTKAIDAQQEATFYRKAEANDISKIYSSEEPLINLTNPNNNPHEITNFSLDRPVFSHSHGDWRGMDAISIRGRAMRKYGKDFESLEPMDVFTAGTDVKVDPRYTTVVSGSDKTLAIAKAKGAMTKKVNLKQEYNTTGAVNSKFNLSKKTLMNANQYDAEVARLASENNRLTVKQYKQLLKDAKKSVKKGIVSNAEFNDIQNRVSKIKSMNVSELGKLRMSHPEAFNIKWGANDPIDVFDVSEKTLKQVDNPFLKYDPTPFVESNWLKARNIQRR